MLSSQMELERDKVVCLGASSAPIGRNSRIVQILTCQKVDTAFCLFPFEEEVLFEAVLVKVKPALIYGLAASERAPFQVELAKRKTRMKLALNAQAAQLPSLSLLASAKESYLSSQEPLRPVSEMLIDLSNSVSVLLVVLPS